MATHSSILAWRTLWTEEPGGLHGVTESDATERTHRVSDALCPHAHHEPSSLPRILAGAEGWLSAP